MKIKPYIDRFFILVYAFSYINFASIYVRKTRYIIHLCVCVICVVRFTYKYLYGDHKCQAKSGGRVLCPKYYSFMEGIKII